MIFNKLYTVQAIALYGLPTLVLMAVFFLVLGFHHFHTKTSTERMEVIIHQYPDGIEERNAPFPLGLILIVAGTVLWGVFYILAYGLIGVKI